MQVVGCFKQIESGGCYKQACGISVLCIILFLDILGSVCQGLKTAYDLVKELELLLDMESPWN